MDTVSFPCLPYILDLAPVDFHFFHQMKILLKCLHLISAVEIMTKTLKLSPWLNFEIGTNIDTGVSLSELGLEDNGVKNLSK